MPLWFDRVDDVANEMRREGLRMDERSKRRLAAGLHPGLVSY